MSHSNPTYTMLILYSFDSDYVSVPCDSFDEGLKIMNYCIEKEKHIVETESEYHPTILELATGEKIFSYTDSEFYDIRPDNYHEHDYALYKVIEINHNPTSANKMKKLLFHK